MGGFKIQSTPSVQQQAGPVILNRDQKTGQDFGAGLFNTASQVAGQFAEKIQQQADVAQMNALKNKTFENMNQLTQEFKNNSKGVNVLEDGKALESQLQEWISLERANVPQRYQEFFDNQAQTSLSDFGRVIQSHQNTELEKYRVKEFQSGQENGVSFIGNNYTDEALVNEKVGEMVANQVAYDAANGQPEELIKENTLNTTTAARAAVLDQMIARGDFNDAKGYLNKYEPEINPAVRAKYLSRLNAAIKSRNAASKKQYIEGVNDYINYLKDGNDAEEGRYTKDQLISVLGGEQGAKLYEKIKDYEDFSKHRGKIELASPEDVNKTLDAMKPKDVEDYTRESKQYDLMASAVNARNREIAADPAKFVMKSDAVSAAYKEAQSTGDWAKFSRATIAEQERLGVPSSMTRILDKSTASIMVQDYNKGGEGAAAFVNDLRDKYGNYFPKVMKDLYKEGLPANAATVAVLGPSAAGTYLSEADKIGAKTLKENIGTDNYKELKSSVNDLLAGDFNDSTTGLANSSTIRGQMSESVEALAMYYLDNGLADSPANAAEKAYNGIIGNRYEFRQSGSTLGFGGNVYRVPKEIDGYEPDVETIDTALDALLDVVPKMSLMPPANERIKSDELREKVYKRRLQARWLTRGDDSGVELVDQNNVPVLTVDGRKIFYSWESLENIDLDSVSNMYGEFE